MFGQCGAVGESPGTHFATVRALTSMSAHVCGDRGGLGKPTKNLVTSQISGMTFPLSLHEYVTPTSFLETERDVFRLVMSVDKEKI